MLIEVKHQSRWHFKCKDCGRMFSAYFAKPIEGHVSITCVNITCRSENLEMDSTLLSPVEIIPDSANDPVEKRENHYYWIPADKIFLCPNGTDKIEVCIAQGLTVVPVRVFERVDYGRALVFASKLAALTDIPFRRKNNKGAKEVPKTYKRKPFQKKEK